MDRVTRDKRIRILLVDDHSLVREGFRRLLEAEPDMEVVGEAADGRSAIQTAERTRPDVVLMDLSMPDMNGIEATRQITGGRGRPRVVCLSVHKEHALIENMLRAGASGYLLKDCHAYELAEAVRSVCSGSTFISPCVSEAVVESFLRKDSQSSCTVPANLTERERQVLQAIAEGRGTKQIAKELGISPKTVFAHREHIMDKLGLHSEAQLTRYAIRSGLAVL
jgi:DNA-binding NarL/FixJ family response regulator